MIGRTARGGVSLRVALARDEPLLETITLSARARALPEVGSALLALQVSAARRARTARHPEAKEELVLVEDAHVGAVVTARSPGVLELIDIAVLPEWQGCGVGTAVLRHLFAVADAQQRTVRASVYHTNPRAHALYRRLGFIEVERNELMSTIERPPRRARGAQASTARVGAGYIVR